MAFVKDNCPRCRMSELKCSCGHGESLLDGIGPDYYLTCYACRSRIEIPDPIKSDLLALIAREQEIWHRAADEAYQFLPVMPGDQFWTVAVPIDRRMKREAGLPHSAD